MWKDLFWLLGLILDPGLKSPYGLGTLLGLGAFTYRQFRQLADRNSKQACPAKSDPPPQTEEATEPKPRVSTFWLVLAVLFFLLLMAQA